MRKTQIEYTLTAPFTYTNGGRQCAATKLVMTAPCNKHSKYTCYLKSVVAKSLITIRKNQAVLVGDDVVEDKTPVSDKASDDDSGITGGIVTYGMYADDSVDMEKVSHMFCSLLCSDLCTIDDTKENMTTAYYNLISAHDSEEILGEYLANFLQPSLFYTKKT